MKICVTELVEKRAFISDNNGNESMVQNKSERIIYYNSPKDNFEEARKDYEENYNIENVYDWVDNSMGEDLSKEILSISKAE